MQNRRCGFTTGKEPPRASAPAADGVQEDTVELLHAATERGLLLLRAAAGAETRLHGNSSRMACIIEYRHNLEEICTTPGEAKS